MLATAIKISGKRLLIAIVQTVMVLAIVIVAVIAIAKMIVHVKDLTKNSFLSPFFSFEENGDFMLKCFHNMKLNIIYSKEFEVERIVNTLKKIDWYKANGYTIQLPASLDVSNITTLSKEIIFESVEKEYFEQNYINSKKYIEDNWSNIGIELLKNIKETSLVLQDCYNIQLTRYGVGGSYHLPNSIIINIQRMFEFGLLKTIAHESVHLSIQKLVEKYNVKHWYKERIVDLLLNKFVPKVNSFQKISIDTQKVDQIFKEFYPNIDKILRKTGSLE